MNSDVTLLVDGREAFPEILRCIDGAEHSVSVNMFIWRDDRIGVEIAEALLRAADRGVQVTVSVDRMGMILEMCEEEERSFFHTRPGPAEKIRILSLRAAYPQNRAKSRGKSEHPGLADKFLSHPNITVEKDRLKADHSKYYIIDDRILIFGGINIEEKERSKDCIGRVYQDYMVKMEGSAYVRAFRDRLEKGRARCDGYRFCMNNKTVSPADFEMRERFLDIINGARQELVIVMAYFAPLREINDAIVHAWERGVKIRILIPENANFQNDSNRKTVYTLMKRCQNGIDLVFCPKMVHTKLISSENTVMLGSCNITNRAFSQLGELDLETANDSSPFAVRLRESVAENFALSRKVTDFSDIHFSPVFAMIESSLN